MNGKRLAYADLSDQELAEELRKKSLEIKGLLTEIRNILKEATDV